MSPRLPLLIRNIQAGKLLETFLIAAVASLLTVRVFLTLTSFPQIGIYNIHIAHMLWGGMFMLAALLVGYIWVNSGAQRLSSVLGGAGFGIFIDEIGKFITKDNNYFFQPSIAIIYLVFISLFLLYRFLESQATFTKQEYIVNALRLLDEVALKQWKIQEKELLHFYLARSGNNPLVQQMQQILKEAHTTIMEPPSSLAKIKIRMWSILNTAAHQAWFDNSIAVYFMLQAMANVGLAGLATYDLLIQLDNPFSALYQISSFYTWGYTLSSLLAASCIIWGSIIIRRNRLSALYWFRRSLLISIFVVELFAFYQQQLSAVYGLALYIVMYGIVNALIEAHHVGRLSHLNISDRFRHPLSRSIDLP